MMDTSHGVYEIPGAFCVEGITLPKNFPTLKDEGIDFDEKCHLNSNSDTLIATYPRTGTSWLVQIVSLLQAGEEDYNETLNTHLNKRHCFMEMLPPCETLIGRDRFDSFKPPRIAKTHLPYQFVNRWVERDGVKTIVSLRNPKDTLVSLFHFYHRVIDTYNGTWNDFFEHVKAGKQSFGDQVAWYESWLKEKEKENIFFISYEDMVIDLKACIKSIAEFLHISPTDSLIDNIVKDAKFDAMSTNSATNYSQSTSKGTQQSKYMRSGKIGQWKNYFTTAQNEWFDTQFGERLEKLGVKFHYE